MSKVLVETTTSLWYFNEKGHQLPSADTPYPITTGFNITWYHLLQKRSANSHGRLVHDDNATRFNYRFV